MLLRVRSKKTVLNWQSFTPQVQDADSQWDSKHFDQESRDYLPSNSRENQSEDDRESTDDGFDLFTDYQVHLSTSRQWLCRRVWQMFFFSAIDWNNFYSKIWIIVHFFVLRHEKQTLSYIHTNLKVIETRFFFLQFILWEDQFFCPNTKNYLGLRGWCPWYYLVWMGLTAFKFQFLNSWYPKPHHTTQAV